MTKFGKALALGTAVAAGPLLAYAAVTVRNHIASESNPDDDFSLRGVFIGSDSNGGFHAQSCADTNTCGIDVDGRREGNGWDEGIDWGGGGGYDSGDYGGAGETPRQDCSAISIETNVDTSDPTVRAAVEKLMEQIRLALQRLGNLPANSRFVLQNGTSVSTSEIYGLLARADFVIDPDSADWSHFANSASRAVILRNEGNPEYRIKAGFLNTILQSGEEGAQAYIFHEISHVTVIGYAEYIASFHPNSAGGSTFTQAESERNESWTDSFAFAIRTALGFPPAPDFYTVAEQQSAPGFSPGSGSASQTVAQTGSCSGA